MPWHPGCMCSSSSGTGLPPLGVWCAPEGVADNVADNRDNAERDEDKPGNGSAVGGDAIEPAPVGPGSRPHLRALDAHPVQKLSRRQRKQLRDMHRPLDSWEKYRALTDMVEELLDLVDLADHKARFALIIMGALNAFLFILASETDAFEAIPKAMRMGMTAVLVVYALIAVYFVLQAIESLRPRKAQPQVMARREDDQEDLPLGLRFHEDALRYSVDEYRTAWRDLRISQLTSELAVQAHALHQINTAKYTALRRLYLGLQIMTIMAALMLGVGTYFVLAGKAEGAYRKGGGKVDAPAGMQRLTGFGVKEPSGAAWHAGRGSLFVVGDDGVLAELDAAGKKRRTYELEPQLEDVAVHDPSGRLVLVSEAKSELLVFDPAEGRILNRVKLDPATLLQQAPGEKNQGFEGLAFRADASRPGGGIFYLAHQRKPSMVVAIQLDAANPPATVAPEAVVGRWPIDAEDLTAVMWSEEMGRLLVLADADDTLLVVSEEGRIRGRLELPGEQQEGIAIGGDGSLWIADDKDKSLLHLPEGLDSLDSAGSVRSKLLLL
jgi:uncharacterized protein YjiK